MSEKSPFSGDAHVIERTEVNKNNPYDPVINGSILVDGHVVEIKDGRVLGLTVSNAAGVLHAGQWNDGHNGVRFEQIKPGAVMMPYASVPDDKFQKLGLDPRLPTNHVLCALVAESRRNLSTKGDVLCVAGGFAEKGESTQTAAHREGGEEAGYTFEDSVQANSIPVITNRLYDNGYGNDLFIPRNEIDFNNLTFADPSLDGIDLCNARHVWKSDTLEGQKGQSVYLVPASEMSDATPDSLAHAAGLSVVNEYYRRLLASLDSK